MSLSLSVSVEAMGEKDYEGDNDASIRVSMNVIKLTWKAHMSMRMWMGLGLSVIVRSWSRVIARVIA